MRGKQGKGIHIQRTSSMKLSRTVTYAVQATLQLAQIDGAETGKPVPCSRLATEGGMPERFLLQILRNLVTRGILRSARGADGGYALRRSLEETSLLDVIEAIDGPLVPRLQAHEGLHEESKKKLECALMNVTQALRQELHTVKLVHLLPTNGRKGHHGP